MAKKTTKTELRELYDNFYYVISSQSGGMKHEQVRCYSSYLERLTEINSHIQACKNNLNHHCKKDEWLINSCFNDIPKRLASFREEHPARPDGEWRKEKEPENIIYVTF